MIYAYGRRQTSHKRDVDIYSEEAAMLKLFSLKQVCSRRWLWNQLCSWETQSTESPAAASAKQRWGVQLTDGNTNTALTLHYSVHRTQPQIHLTFSMQNSYRGVCKFLCQKIGTNQKRKTRLWTSSQKDTFWPVGMLESNAAAVWEANWSSFQPPCRDINTPIVLEKWHDGNLAHRTRAESEKYINGRSKTQHLVWLKRNLSFCWCLWDDYCAGKMHKNAGSNVDMFGWNGDKPEKVIRNVQICIWHLNSHLSSLLWIWNVKVYIMTELIN